MKASVFANWGLVLGLLLSSPRMAVSQGVNAGPKLEVQLNYSGNGTVDEKHKIYVVWWDSPDFVKGGGTMPVSIQPSSSKDGLVTFDDVKTTPAYVSTAYDPTGRWDAQSPPPEGSSLGLYSKTAGKPEAIDVKPGKTTKIEVAFDDSVKMKGGQPTR